MRHLIRVQIVETDTIVSALPDTRNNDWTKELSYFVLALAGFAALVGLLFMTGCGSGGFEGRTAQSAAVKMGSIEGSVRQGATAASGSRVYLLETATDGTSTPQSLLTESTQGSTADGSGVYAVTADTLGQFAIHGSISCTTGASVYLSAAGRAGAQTRMLGVCSATEQWNVATGVTVDAASTVAMKAENAGVVELAQSF
jgi:hypothetical protein